MGKKNNKIPSVAPGFKKSGEIPRIEKEPYSSNNMKLSWALSTFDHNGPWGLDAIKGTDWLSHLLGHIKNFEGMTWGEILKGSGGRTSGNNSHEIEVSKLSPNAQKRIIEIKQEDTDTIFSLRLEGKVRIYGIKENAVLKILWFDPWHNIADKGVCPSVHR